MKPLIIEYTPEAQEEWRRLNADQKEAARRLIRIIKARGGFDWGYGFGNRWLRYVASDEVRILFRVVMLQDGDKAIIVAIQQDYTPPLEERD